MYLYFCVISLNFLCILDISMSPPEVWGPAVWTLFHTLSAKINEDAYPQVSLSLFKMITSICKFLPCPECSSHASTFLAKINLSDLKTKADFKNTFYLFHNSVNSKKRKHLFKYSNLDVYGTYRLVGVVNNFIAKYNTKGNMKLIAESFQRQLIIKQFRSWFVGSIRAFISKMVVPPPLPPMLPPTLPEVQPEIVTEVQPEIVTEIMPEIVTETQPEIVTEVQPEIVTEVQPEIVTEVVPEIVTEVQPEIVTEVVPEIVTEVQPEIVTEVILELPVLLVPPDNNEIPFVPDNEPCCGQTRETEGI